MSTGPVGKARAEIPGLVVADYVIRKPSSGEPRELILLLHGFMQSGEYMHRKLASHCPEDAAVLSPCAPYPLPERRPEGEYRLGFCWYFYNAAKDDYYIDMRVALAYLESLVASLGYSALPKRVAGFSQGGYLAPFAAARLGGARQVIGLGASYLPEEMREAGLGAPVFRCDGVHGAEDEVVGMAGARDAHAAVLAAGGRGEFATVPGVGHRISPEVAAEFARLVRLG